MIDFPANSMSAILPGPSGAGRMVYQAAASPVAAPATAAAAQEPGSAGALQADTLTISQRGREALLERLAAQKAKEQAAEADGIPTWESLFGMADGVKLLKNGHTQVTTIKGSELLVQEFDGDRLVGKQTGSITGNAVVMDIERYDAAGRVIQSTHSELTGLSSDGLASGANFTRSSRWFENGQLARDYTDSMTLSASYSGVPEFEPIGSTASELADLAGAMTTDGMATNFRATVSEYEDGTLRRSAEVRQNTSLKLVANRSDRARSGLPAHSVRELAEGSQSGFSASISAYDAEGKLLHEASFAEEITPDAVKKQRLETASYEDGQIVQRGSGTFEGEVPSGQGPNAQLLLDTLGMGQAEYDTTTPNSAAGMLAANFRAATDSADFYVADAPGTNGQGYFGSARNLESYQNTTAPYELSWTSEVFREGKLAARQTDTEGAAENHDARGLQFGLARGLAEDESPSLLRSASHTDESYTPDGSLARSATLERHEEMAADGRDVLRLRTRSRGRQTGSGAPVSLSATQQAPLDEVDAEAHLASQRFNASADVTLGAATRLLRRLSVSR